MDFPNDDFLELPIGNSAESLQRFLASQRDLFHSQIDQFQEIVVTQCKLTGVNPLSQEMAAGALSIKIGKRPRDLLNPKAVNYMQSVFSIKDAISKKESREISALFGVTVTQVRDFFNGQRSRVRRFVLSSREKALKSNSCEEPQDELINSDPMRPINPAPLNSIMPSNAEGASCSTQDAALSDLDDLDKKFVDNIFSLMEKEESFSGQEKLMEWILTIQNFSVLLWFLTRGGVMILATWLSVAAVEEQTSVLLLILKVLCHLPLHKALPTHISAILPCVNRLRFYRTSEFVEPPFSTVYSHPCSIGQIMGSESWDSNMNVHEDILALSNDHSDNFRKLESSHAVKLLPSSSDDSNKKLALGVSSSQSNGPRERRKVQLVEQPGQKSVTRSPQATRVAPINQGRPMSADDIQKAKMRALFMQSKYAKNGSSKENKNVKIDGLHKHQTNQASIAACSAKVPVPPRIEDDKRTSLLPSSKATNRLETSYSKPRTDANEPVWEKCKRVQIPWKTPAEVKLRDTWSVGAGENSKEVDVQKNRNRREKETIYQTVQEIPSNPKEPWDLEMDYDDTLTLEIPIEQLPDVDGAELAFAPDEVATHAVQGVPTPSSTSNVADTAQPDLELLAVLLKNPDLVFALTSGQGGSIPSEETVKVLDMIKRGDMNLGTHDTNHGNDISAKPTEKVEVSLPSPTPSSDPRTVRDFEFILQLFVKDVIMFDIFHCSSMHTPLSHLSSKWVFQSWPKLKFQIDYFYFLVLPHFPEGVLVKLLCSTSGWSTMPPKNPFSRQSLAPARSYPAVATTNLISQVPAIGTTVIRQQPTMALPSSNPFTSTVVSSYSLPQATIVPETEMQPPLALSSLHVQQTPLSDIGLTMKNKTSTNPSSVNLPGAHSPLAMRVNGTSNVKPVPNMSVEDGLSNSFPQSFRLASTTPSLSATQLQQRHAHLASQQAHFPEPSYRNSVHSYPPPQIEKPGQVSDSWRVRQDVPSSSYHSNRNQNYYDNAYVGGSMQAGPSWDRNNQAAREQYETWSPDNSPTRNPRYVPGRSYPESRVNQHGRNHRPDWSRQRGSSGHWDPARQGNRKWHDERR
ncbi:hypothetical protein Ahy_A06g027018 isoform C [Arachis hypogaea]|uniref:Homeobox domain-containing protein n=1 Tax=Arachis hypogaea TaxID=3818 RepID=A0A445CMF4_ARAHY|nr:hypothetical protein Ahy_A06g027018 isoform C [Arachis hypogaea]